MTELLLKEEVYAVVGAAIKSIMCWGRVFLRLFIRKQWS